MSIKARIWTLPNIVTFFRIAAIPLVVLLLLSSHKTTSVIAAVVFLLAALTDCLDGYLARKRNTVTNLGKLLDPLADKLLVCTALIMLIALDRVGAWIVAVIIARELSVTTLRGLAGAQGLIIAASRLGKFKTVTQVVACTLLILHYPYYGIDTHGIGMIVIWIALVITVWSGVDYFARFFRVF
jgi:CDP-diacylglycerol--glycerol-3-phosphate 3-phosphatidyltransferase